jgi:hypothetical protein
MTRLDRDDVLVFIGALVLIAVLFGAGWLAADLWHSLRAVP